MKEYVYSLDKDDWMNAADTIDEALLDCDAEEGSIVTVYRGEKAPDKIGSYIDIDGFLDDAAGNICDQVEGYEFEIILSEEAQKEFRDLVNGWADKHGLQPESYTIEKIQEGKKCLNHELAEARMAQNKEWPRIIWIKED